MTNVELQKILGDRIALTLTDMDMEKRVLENERTELILDISKQMIANGNLLLKADKEYSENSGKKSVVAKDMILGKDASSGWLNKNK